MTDATAAPASGWSVEEFRKARRRGATRSRRVGLPRGHRRRRGVPVQRRGVVHHRPDAVRRRRRQDLSERHAARPTRGRRVGRPLRHTESRMDGTSSPASIATPVLARLPAPVAPARSSPSALTAALALAGCTRSTRTPPTTAPAPSRRAQGLTVAGEWPLTGLPATGDRRPKHPVMVVKIDNTDEQPPAGRARARPTWSPRSWSRAARPGSRCSSTQHDARATSARCARCGPATSASSSRPRRAGGQRRRRRRPSTGSRPPASRSSPRAPPATTATAAARRRTTCSCTSTELAKTVEGQGHRRRATCRRGDAKDFPQGQTATRARRGVLRRAHHELDLPRRAVRQPEQLRRRRRPVPARQRAGAAGQGRRRRLPRPGRQPGAGDASSPARARRCSSTTAGWCAAPGRSRWTSTIKLSTKAGELQGAGRPHLDRAGARRTAATSPSRSSRSTRRRPSSGSPGARSAAGRPDSASVPQAGEDEADRGLDLGAGLRGVLGGRHRCAGRRHRAEEDPAEGLAPCSLELVASARAPSATISWTMPKVERSSCSRNRS